MDNCKPNRMYHLWLDKYGDIIQVSDGWVTARLDGDKDVGCWEVDAPYIKIFIPEENLKPEPLPENPLAELLKDKWRLEWILSDTGNYWLSSREDIDKEMGTL